MDKNLRNFLYGFVIGSVLLGLVCVLFVDLQNFNPLYWILGTFTTIVVFVIRIKTGISYGELGFWVAWCILHLIICGLQMQALMPPGV